MIEIKFIDGMCCPMVFCDVCDTQVKSAALAMAAWGEGLRTGARLSPSYVHKGRCLAAFERGLPKGQTLMTDELNEFFTNLLSNSKAKIRR